MPQLSVIIATYNVERTIERLLDSLAIQRFRDFEIVLVDGGSSDRTLAILAERAPGEIACLISEPDKGIYDAWNKGLRVARGQWLAFIGADDYLGNPDSLTRMQTMAASGRYNYLCGRARLVDMDGHQVRIYGKAMRPEGLRAGMMVAHPGSWHARVLFDELGEFDTSYRIAGDLDFLLRARPLLRSGFIDDIVIDVENAGVSYANFARSVGEAARAIRLHVRGGAFFSAVFVVNLRLRHLVKRILMPSGA